MNGIFGGDTQMLPISSNPGHLNAKKRTNLSTCSFYLEVTPRFELGNKGFADLGLTTWLCHHILYCIRKISELCDFL